MVKGLELKLTFHPMWYWNYFLIPNELPYIQIPQQWLESDDPQYGFSLLFEYQLEFVQKNLKLNQS